MKNVWCIEEICLVWNYFLWISIKAFKNKIVSKHFQFEIFINLVCQSKHINFHINNNVKIFIFSTKSCLEQTILTCLRWLPFKSNEPYSSNQFHGRNWLFQLTISLIIFKSHLILIWTGCLNWLKNDNKAMVNVKKEKNEADLKSKFNECNLSMHVHL